MANMTDEHTKNMEKSLKYFKKKVATYEREMKKCDERGLKTKVTDYRIMMNHCRNAIEALEVYLKYTK